jgi:hypothetical protein
LIGSKRSITYRSEKTEAAARVVPWLIAVMAFDTIGVVSHRMAC